MTREEYLENHDAREGAEEPETVPFLKPCPFCGGEASQMVYKNEAVVKCIVCDARTGILDTEEEAVEAWNRRDD